MDRLEVPERARAVGSNSHGQREWIEAERDRRGLSGPQVITADVNTFATARRFDRIVSVEMFEHMNNWRELLHRMAGWLEPDGRAFVHVFSHRRIPYRFEGLLFGFGASDRSFTAGTMPSHDLLLRFQDDLAVTEESAVDGAHYARGWSGWTRAPTRRWRCSAAIAGCSRHGGCS